ncbi:MAG: DUF3164 family protein [Bacteroidales bacterium]|nr:DUF3164 family protein [Bacteroidales bacterium]
MSVEELEKLLAEKKKEQIAKKQQEREHYEASRDNIVETTVEEAKELHKKLYDFKKTCLDQMEGFREMAHQIRRHKKHQQGRVFFAAQQNPRNDTFRS